MCVSAPAIANPHPTKALLLDATVLIDLKEEHATGSGSPIVADYLDRWVRGGWALASTRGAIGQAGERSDVFPALRALGARWGATTPTAAWKPGASAVVVGLVDPCAAVRLDMELFVRDGLHDHNLASIAGCGSHSPGAIVALLTADAGLKRRASRKFPSARLWSPIGRDSAHATTRYQRLPVWI